MAEPTFYSEGPSSIVRDNKRKVLMKVLARIRAIIIAVQPANIMSSPTFYSEGSTPEQRDTEYKITQKILGALADLQAALSGTGCITLKRRLSGAGSPQGVVTACVGQDYLDTVTGNEWQKVTGDNTNTGWI